MLNFKGRRADLYRYLLLSGIQLGLERWWRKLLLGMFRTPLMCREGVLVPPALPHTGGRGWCVVEDVSYRVLATSCEFDPLCGGIVYSPSRPPSLVVYFTLCAGLLVSLLTVWLPRLLVYRSKRRLLVSLQKNCRRVLLRAVLTTALVRSVLELLTLHYLPALPAWPLTLLCTVVGGAAVHRYVRPTSRILISRVEGGPQFLSIKDVPGPEYVTGRDDSDEISSVSGKYIEGS